MNTVSVNSIHAVLSKNQAELDSFISSKDIIDIIIDFITFGWLTRKRREHIADLRLKLYFAAKKYNKQILNGDLNFRISFAYLDSKINIATSTTSTYIDITPSGCEHSYRVEIESGDYKSVLSELIISKEMIPQSGRRKIGFLSASFLRGCICYLVSIWVIHL